MKTVKEISEITGITIRTLRYYDEIGLLKPTQLTEAGYRLYDNKALEKLQAIMFFRELEIPLTTIRDIMENPDYDKEQVLRAQKSLLEHKRNRLNGIIELITDVMKGVNTMSFEAFNDEDINKIIDHSLELQGDTAILAIIEKFGSMEAFRNYVSQNFKNEKTAALLIKIYGSKDKAVAASLQATGDQETFKKQQEDNDRIFRQFALAKENSDETLSMAAVEQLAENYKQLFHLDNARNLLLEIASNYLEQPLSPLGEATDQQYGIGVTEYVGHAIRKYYGV